MDSISAVVLLVTRWRFSETKQAHVSSSKHVRRVVRNVELLMETQTQPVYFFDHSGSVAWAERCGASVTIEDEPEKAKLRFERCLPVSTAVSACKLPGLPS